MKYINAVKNLTIVILAMLAVFLTGKLWFENISGYSFFQTFLSRYTPIIDDTGGYANTEGVKPISVRITGRNTGENILLSGIDQSEQKHGMDEIISVAMLHGNLVGERDYHPELFIRRPAIVYTYPAFIPTQAFVQVYPQKGTLLTGKLNTVYQVMAYPKDAERTALLITDGKKICEYEVASVLIGKEALAGIDEQSVLNTGGPAVPLSLRLPNIINPYMSDGGLLKEKIQKLVAPFFTESASQEGVIQDSVFTYSADDVIVKYRQGLYDTLEYYRYRLPYRQTVSADLSYYNYCAALDFIAGDELVMNDCFLAGMDQRAADNAVRYTFYFDYAVNNTALTIGEDCTEATGMNHAIAVTVEDGWVIQYKKLVYEFEAGENS